jgi:hypothetical protein
VPTIQPERASAPVEAIILNDRVCETSISQNRGGMHGNRKLIVAVPSRLARSHVRTLGAVEKGLWTKPHPQ